MWYSLLLCDILCVAQIRSLDMDMQKRSLSTFIERVMPHAA